MHPRIPDYQKQLVEGKITRREFLRFTTLLGLSASSALALAACGQPAAAPAPTLAPAPTAALRIHWGANPNRSPQVDD